MAAKGFVVFPSSSLFHPLAAPCPLLLPRIYISLSRLRARTFYIKQLSPLISRSTPLLSRACAPSSFSQPACCSSRFFFVLELFYSPLPRSNFILFFSLPVFCEPSYLFHKSLSSLAAPERLFPHTDVPFFFAYALRPLPPSLPRFN